MCGQCVTRADGRGAGFDFRPQTVASSMGKKRNHRFPVGEGSAAKRVCSERDRLKACVEEVQMDVDMLKVEADALEKEKENLITTNETKKRELRSPRQKVSRPYSMQP